MTALAAPASWLDRTPRAERRFGLGNGSSGEDTVGLRGLGNGSSREDTVGFRELGNGSSREDRPAGISRPSAGFGNGSLTEDRPTGASQPTGGLGLDGAIVGFNDGAEVAVRRSARNLHAACAELLPGYSAASREPWRQALLTAGCLDERPRPSSSRLSAPPLIVEDVVQPSDVLCALWLARRCGLFSPGSPCGDGVGLRSACEIVPSFAPTLAAQRRADVLEVLRANTAWRAHQLARAA